jgi:hypothetical protein
MLRKKINPDTNALYTDDDIKNLFYHNAKSTLTNKVNVAHPDDPPSPRSAMKRGEQPSNLQHQNTVNESVGAEVPKYIREVAAIQSYFSGLNQQCNTQAAMQLKDKADQLYHSADLPPWSRSPMLNKRQLEIMDAIVNDEVQVVFVEGDKRTGKSTTWFNGVCESVWDGKIKRWGFWSKSQDNACSILRDVKNDPITVEQCGKLYNGSGSANRLSFFNGGFIEVGATDNPNSSSGQAFQGIVIDETHNVITENPKTFAMIAMILRSEKHMKMIFCANQGMTAFQMLKAELLTNIDPKNMKFFTLLKSDCTHISESNDKLIRVLVNASAGEEMAAQFLDNQIVREGDLIYPMAPINEAFDPNHPLPSFEQYDSFGMGVDWGDVHDTAIHIIGFKDNQAYEQETLFLQHATDILLLSTFTRIINQYPGITIAWENSPLGSFIRNSLRDEFPNTSFVDSGFSNHKKEYVDNIYVWLVQKCLHLKNVKLKHQLIQYKGDKKNDDGHDALAHLLYQCQCPRTLEDLKITFIEK